MESVSVVTGGLAGGPASLADAPSEPPRALDMVRTLVVGHEAVARTARELFPIADKAQDEPTADLLTQRLTVHEQTAWMLRALLEQFFSNRTDGGHVQRVARFGKSERHRGAHNTQTNKSQFHKFPLRISVSIYPGNSYPFLLSGNKTPASGIINTAQR